MCYRDNVPTLDLDGIHVACLCGNNGNGKSALIDAISWALWGKARARSDDELIYSTQKQMEVDFEFDVGKNRYRIIRKHSRAIRKLPGQTLLELQVKSNGKFKSITGNTVRKTQRKISEILRMDYETFINSVFLLQGHADEFTVKSPSERKKVLSEILNLSFYDKLEGKAKELAKQMEIECKILESTIEEIKRELNKEEEYQTELQDVEAELIRSEAQLKSHEDFLNQLRRTRDELELKKRQLREVESRIKLTETELGELESKRSKHCQKIEEYKRIFAEREIVEREHATLVIVRKENEELSRKLTMLLSLTERKNKLEQTIERARGNLLTNKTMLEREIGRLEAKIETRFRIETDLTEIQNRLCELKRTDEEFAEKRHQIEELQNQIQYLKAVNAKLKEEMEELKSKIALISQGDTHCPLCGTELGTSGIREVVAKYENENQAKAKECEATEQETNKLEENYQILKDEVKKFEVELSKERTLSQSRQIALENEKLEVQKSIQRLSQLKSEFSQITEQLEVSKFAEEEHTETKDLISQIENLGYDGKRHQLIREQISELEKYDELKRKLDEAEKLLSQEENLLSYAEEGIKNRRSALKLDTERRQNLLQDLSVLPEILATLRKEEKAYENLRLQREQRLKVKVTLEENIRRCVEREKQRAEKTGLLDKVAKEKGIYSELAASFGKKGVQALIIEQALPEIEEEANKLLGRMTDNRLSLSLESQRETKKGELVETLDIKIQDELGVRSYEMFSGGEAFRVNFALRIALSKLLAKRAGAPFPTLFIDEGFGTQDSSGKEKLIEAINSIQEDFERIIVITHIGEIKDIFPVRIEVTKGVEGSTFTVN